MFRADLGARSSVVEHPTFNRMVPGSNPGGRTTFPFRETVLRRRRGAISSNMYVSGATKSAQRRFFDTHASKECRMNGIIYLVGLVVVILAVLSFFGLR